MRIESPQRTFTRCTRRSVSMLPRVEAGDSLLRVHYDHELGAGKFASVYAAELLIPHVEKPGFTIYPVAAKSLSQNTDTASLQEMKLQKIVSTSKESSGKTGLLKVLGIMMDQESRPYIVLPMCHATLSKCLPDIAAIKQNEFSVYAATTIYFLESMLAALKTLNTKGIAHGDIKPDNIAFREEGFCLIDFGCAKEMSSTETDELSGTPLYMSPEYIAEQKLAQKDIFALGLVLEEWAEGTLSDRATISRYDNYFAFLMDRGHMLDAARKQHLTANHNPQEYQTSLCKELSRFNNFEDCLQCLYKKMRAPLPEHRPDFITIKIAIEQLKKLSPTVTLQNITRFYMTMGTRKNTQPRKRVSRSPETESSDNIKKSRTEPRHTTTGIPQFSPSPKKPTGTGVTQQLEKLVVNENIARRLF